MVVHLLPAFGAEDKSGQRICLIDGIRPLWCGPELLYQFPCLPVDDGFMGVTEYQPVLLRGDNDVLVLVRVLL